MKHYTFTVTPQELDIILRAINEVPLKYSGSVWRTLEKQILEQDQVDNQEVKADN